MRLYEVFAAKRIPLLEGIKFTTAQIEDVKKEQHNIYIGVEYEYHVDMKGAIDHKTLEDQALEDFNEYIQEEVQDLIHEKRIASAASAFYTINHILHNNFLFFNLSLKKISEVQNKLEKSNNESIDIEQKDRTYLNCLLDSYQKTVNYIDSNHLNQNGEISQLNFNFIHRLEETQDFFPVNNLNYNQETYNAIVNFIKFLVNDKTRNLFKKVSDNDIFPYHLWVEIITHLMKMKSEWEEVQSFVHHTEKITQSFKSFNERTIENATQYFEENIEDYINVDKNEWIQDRVETLIGGSGNTLISGSATPKVNYIRSILHNNHDNKWGVNTSDIEKVKEDPSVTDGVETVLKPLPLDKAFKQMLLMFDHIADVGNTSTSTGLHVNMSIKNERFTKENFDPLKLIMLLDNDEMIGKFPIRGCVDDVLEFITPDFLIGLSKMHEVSHNSLEIVDFLSKSIDKSKKLQGINFRHLYSNFVSSDEKRIEFRYMGGKDYESRFKEIQRYIYKYAYMLMASFDPDFLRREYLTRAYQILNKKASEFFIFGLDVNSKEYIDTYYKLESFSDISFYENKIKKQYPNRDIDIKLKDKRKARLIKKGSLR